MFLCKPEKQVKEHFVGFVVVLLWLNGTPLPLLTHTLLKERDIWKELWVWGQEGKPRICHFRLWLEVFQVPSCYVSLSLSRGHLRMKSCPYHFPVIMMHEPTGWPAFPGKGSPPRMLQGEGGFASPYSWRFPSPGSFPPLALAIGHSNWKQRISFPSCLQISTAHTIKIRDGLTPCDRLNYIIPVKTDNAVLEQIFTRSPFAQS